VSDPYVYEGTDVLVNHFGVTDGDELDRVERVVTELGVWRRMQAPPPESFGLAFLREVHEGIFGEIYPFAGELRTVVVRKQEPVLSGRSVDYADPAAIEDMVEDSAARMEALAGNPSSLAFASAVSGVWKAHPFREGNTRTVLVFLHQFCRAHGMPLDFETLSRSPQDVRDALALAATGVPERLAASLGEAFRSARRREHPVLGRLTAEAGLMVEGFGRIPVSVAADGDRVRGHVACVSYKTVIAETARGIVGVPLASFPVQPSAGERFDLIVHEASAEESADMRAPAFG